MTGVSQKWLGKPNGGEREAFALCDGAIEYLPGDRIAKIPEETGHHGIKRTHRLIQRPVHQVKRSWTGKKLVYLAWNRLCATR